MTINVAILDGTTVTNVIVVDSLSEGPEGCVECPVWIGVGMDINSPAPEVLPGNPQDPVAKLKTFLAANPDVAEILI